MELRHIPRKENEEADSLAKLGSTREALLSGAFLDVLTKPSIRLEVERGELPKLNPQVNMQVEATNLD